jgi:hypothetical protein
MSGFHPTLVTQKGKQVFVHEGHQFIVHNSHQGGDQVTTYYLRCRYCKQAMLTVKGENYEEVKASQKTHLITCEGGPTKLAQELALSELQARTGSFSASASASASSLSSSSTGRFQPDFIRNEYSAVRDNLPADQRGGFPQLKTVVRSVQRNRAMSVGGSLSPTTMEQLAEMEIPYDFQHIKFSGDDEPDMLILQLFIEYTENDGTASSFLVFATEDGLRHLAAAKRVFTDGTFAITPKPQYTKGQGQVVTLNTLAGVHGDEALYTRVMVAAQRRTQLFYDILFSSLLDHMLLKLSISMLDIAWESFTLDFETALIPALDYLSTVAFVPDGRSLQLDGCFFHFAAALFKFLCSVGLKVEYGALPEL